MSTASNASLPVMEPLLDTTGMPAFLARFECWLNGEISEPPALPDLSDAGLFMAARDAFIARFGYAVPGPGFVSTLARLGRVLEVGAGNGYLSHALRAHGVDAVATDPAPGTLATDRPIDVGRYHARDALDTLATPRMTVLCSWPGYGTSWLTDLARALRPGQRLVHIGEGEGGCTADDSFFEYARAFMTDESRMAEPFCIQQFPFIHDDLTILKKNEAGPMREKG